MLSGARGGEKEISTQIIQASDSHRFQKKIAGFELQADTIASGVGSVLTPR